MTADPVPIRPAASGGRPFGQMLRRLRIRAGLSQNALARRAGIDPAYVNRLEHAENDSAPTPSRKVVIRLADVLDGGPSDRERLLVSSGHCPEAIMIAGGWDAYHETIRKTLTDEIECLTRRALRFMVTGDEGRGPL